MIRPGTVLWLILVAFVGFAMFKVKYEVMDLEDELARTNRAITADQDAIHVLKAEWAFLGQPSRLAELSRRYLELTPLGTAQLGQITAIPLRPSAIPLAIVEVPAPLGQLPVLVAKPPAAKPSVVTTTLAATTVANAKSRTNP